MAPWWVSWKEISVYAILCLQWKNLFQDFLSEEIPLQTGWKARVARESPSWEQSSEWEGGADCSVALHVTVLLFCFGAVL